MLRLKVGEFKATTFDELFEKTKALPWERFLPGKCRISGSGKSVKSKLFSVSDCQAIVKKAIVERLKKHYKRDGWFEENGPLFKIEVALLKDVALLTIDTSGSGLHKRGYRVGQGEAPIKRNLGCSSCYANELDTRRPFVDPFCGSGTFQLKRR